MKAPFPYMGGKSTVASVIWQAIGQDVGHYIEPFFGSGAVLLNRPNYDPARHTETVNDADGFVCNAWRSIQLQPDETARWCDWPVNHADLCARKKELLKNKDRLLEGLKADPQWCDPVLGGYWVWAASCWIGSGLTRPNAIPHISDKGNGVHASIKGSIYAWFDQLSIRLRLVRVVCGDWSQVCGGDWQDANWSTCGIFFDPPYGTDSRDTVYGVDSFDVAHKVADWAIERGNRKNYRIVIAGYDEHPRLIEAGWTTHNWSTGGGYGNTARSGVTNGQVNRHREVLYLSPHCRTIPKQRNLF